MTPATLSRTSMAVPSSADASAATDAASVISSA